MTVALLPPLDDIGYWPSSRRVLREALAEGPEFISKRHPQRAGFLWHRPRAGYHELREYGPDEVTTHWHLWCGQTARSDRAELVDELPAGGRVCGTCDGRAAGAGQIPGPGYPTKFTPRGTEPPAWCPGSGRSGLWLPLSGSAGRCGVCGAVEAVRWMGGVFNGDAGIVRHQPAIDLLTVRCDHHAWRSLVLDDTGRAVCRCTRPNPCQ